MDSSGGVNGCDVGMAVNGVCRLKLYGNEFQAMGWGWVRLMDFSLKLELRYVCVRDCVMCFHQWWFRLFSCTAC